MKKRFCERHQNEFWAVKQFCTNKKLILSIGIILAAQTLFLNTEVKANDNELYGLEEVCDFNIEESPGSAMGCRFNMEFEEFADRIQEIYSEVYSGDPFTYAWEAGEVIVQDHAQIETHVYTLYMGAEEIMLGAKVEEESGKLSSIDIMIDNTYDDWERFRDISAICLSAANDLSYKEAQEYVIGAIKAASEGKKGYSGNLCMALMDTGNGNVDFMISPANDEFIENMKNGVEIVAESSDSINQQQFGKSGKNDTYIDEEVSQKISEILQSTYFYSMNATAAEMLVTVFNNYDIEVERYDTESKYAVTFSGDYYPSPDVDTTLSGSITLLIDIESGALTVLGEPGSVGYAFEVFAATYFNDSIY